MSCSRSFAPLLSSVVDVVLSATHGVLRSRGYFFHLQHLVYVQFDHTSKSRSSFVNDVLRSCFDTGPGCERCFGSTMDSMNTDTIPPSNNWVTIPISKKMLYTITIPRETLFFLWWSPLNLTRSSLSGEEGSPVRRPLVRRTAAIPVMLTSTKKNPTAIKNVKTTPWPLRPWFHICLMYKPPEQQDPQQQKRVKHIERQNHTFDQSLYHIHAVILFLWPINQACRWIVRFLRPPLCWTVVINIPSASILLPIW